MRRRTADHLVEIRASRHHRVHRVFLFHLEIDHRGAAGSARRFDGAGHLFFIDSGTAVYQLTIANGNIRLYNQSRE